MVLLPFFQIGMPNSEHLRLIQAPVFRSADELSSLMHVSVETLVEVAYNSYSFYRRFEIPKRDGSYRQVFCPNQTVKAIQAWILRNILVHLSPSIHATAFRSGISIREHVRPHKANRYFLTIDIADFFPSITQHRVFSLFLDVGYQYQEATLLSLLCTCGGMLPQGGVTSPAISNLVTYRLDRRLSGYVSKKNIVYTRYADDMTFSSNNRSALNHSLQTLAFIVNDEGFALNARKTRFMGPSRQVVVTGLVKDSDAPKFGIGRKRVNWMRCVMFNLAVNRKSIDERYGSPESIDGWLSYLRSVDSASWAYLRRYWKRIRGVD